MINNFILTSLVRSGGTLNALLLNSHRNISCAPEPFFGFFKYFRNDILILNKMDLKDGKRPLSDYFGYDGDELSILLKSDLNVPIISPWSEIREYIIEIAKDNDPRVIPHIPSKSPDTYLVLFQILIDILKMNSNFADGAIGFKQAWTEVFSATLLNTFPDFRVLHLIRDPRSILASWKSTTDLRHDYPFLMVLRHWRKSALLGQIFKKKYPDRFLSYRYEDLVLKPVQTFSSICQHIGVDFQEQIFSANKIKNINGEVWDGNSSYRVVSNGSISNNLTDKWTERLSKDEIDLINYLCAPCMSGYGYEYPESIESVNLSKIWRPPFQSELNPSSWLHAYRGEYAFSQHNLSLEGEFVRLFFKNDKSTEEIANYNLYSLESYS
jgi:hypothetical protein